MYLASNEWGYNLVEVIELSSLDLVDKMNYGPLTGCMVVVMCKGQCLIAYNRWRKQWELPAGGIEEGEGLEVCARRELLEETNQSLEALKFVGLLKIYDSRKGLTKYQGLFYGEKDELDDFQTNDEMADIDLWQVSDDMLDSFDSVDFKVLKECLRIVENQPESSL